MVFRGWFSAPSDVHFRPSDYATLRKTTLEVIVPTQAVFVRAVERIVPTLHYLSVHSRYLSLRKSALSVRFSHLSLRKRSLSARSSAIAYTDRSIDLLDKKIEWGVGVLDGLYLLMVALTSIRKWLDRLSVL